MSKVKLMVYLYTYEIEKIGPYYVHLKDGWGRDRPVLHDEFCQFILSHVGMPSLMVALCIDGWMVPILQCDETFIVVVEGVEVSIKEMQKFFDFASSYLRLSTDGGTKL